MRLPHLSTGFCGMFVMLKSSHHLDCRSMCRTADALLVVWQRFVVLEVVVMLDASHLPFVTLPLLILIT